MSAMRLQVENGRLDMALVRAGRHYRVALDVSEGFVTYGLLILLAVFTAGIVGASHWVAGTDNLTWLALFAVLTTILISKLAPRDTTYWLSVETTGVVALFLATGQRTSAGPFADFGSWIVGISHSLELAVLVCMSGGTWLLAAWTTYWILRRHQLSLALGPMAVVVAAEVINDPAQAGIYARAGIWVVLAVTLSLRLNLVRLARRWRDYANEQLGWSITLAGGRTLGVIIVLAIVLPPLTTIDLSTRMFVSQGRSGFSTPGDTGGTTRRPGVAGGFQQTGYSEKVEPAGTLTRSATPVLEVSDDLVGTVYWRGIDLYGIQGGSWYSGDPFAIGASFAANDQLATDPFVSRQQVHGRVKVLSFPQATIFFPGEPEHVSLPTQVRGDLPPSGARFPLTLDAVSAIYNATGAMPAGTSYTLTGSVSTATDTALRAAGTDYSAVVRRATYLDRGRLNGITPQVAQLAQKVAAGAANPYDQVKQIESYLRTHYRYRLEVSLPTGSSPIDYFLFSSREGYCEYFASAMGEMVRSLGIPVRLVNGYGPGVLDEKTKLTTIRASDAHTWVEVYFPRYGWVAFEPTPDPNYPAIDHSAQATPPAATPPARDPNPGQVPPGSSRQPHPGVHAPSPLQLLPFAGLLLAAAAIAGALRLLVGAAQPADMAVPWRRLGWVARRTGVMRSETDTPLEFATRLSLAAPALAEDIRTLGHGYSYACYSRSGADLSPLESSLRAWEQVRSRLIRLLLLGR